MLSQFLVYSKVISLSLSLSLSLYIYIYIYIYGHLGVRDLLEARAGVGLEESDWSKSAKGTGEGILRAPCRPLRKPVSDLKTPGLGWPLRGHQQLAGLNLSPQTWEATCPAPSSPFFYIPPLPGGDPGRGGRGTGAPNRCLPIPGIPRGPGQTGEEGAMLEAEKWTKLRARPETCQNITEGGKWALPPSLAEGSGSRR